MNRKNYKTVLILVSLFCGILITTLTTVLAFNCRSRQCFCTFGWQGCVAQTIWHTPDNPAHEGSLIDLFSFWLGVPFGIPIYSLLTYVLLLPWRRRDNSVRVRNR